MADAAMGTNARITVDLEQQVVIRPDGTRIPFEVDAFRKHCLLNGLDDIGLTLGHRGAIDSFESRQPEWQPAITGV
jgi:3-isopropylmalate/(R)-2-methylmalate dehydratase small subunit